MWQADSWDPRTIEAELGYARALGFTTMRVFLHYLAWKQDSEGFFARVDEYLGLADAKGLSTMLVLNDSVWNPNPSIGKQPEPVPFRHNSGWVQSPGAKGLLDKKEYALVEAYVRQTVARFAHDDRILAWDILNEPDNDNGGRFKAEPRFKVPLAFKLMRDSFAWAREAGPEQPLTAGLWRGDWSDPRTMGSFNTFQIEQSDVLSFHSYDPPEGMMKRIAEIAAYGRPSICTEYMARTAGSRFQEILPLLKAAGIGAINWGFVSGRSQTIYPWDSWEKEYRAEPKPWFHDILRPDGSPFDPAETLLIRRINGKER